MLLGCAISILHLLVLARPLSLFNCNIARLILIYSKMGSGKGGAGKGGAGKGGAGKGGADKGGAGKSYVICHPVLFFFSLSSFFYLLTD